MARPLPHTVRSSLRGGLLLIGSAALGLLINAVHPAGLPLLRPVYSQAEIGQCSGPGLAQQATGLGPGQGPQGLQGPGQPALAAPQALTPGEAARLRNERAKGGLVIGDLRPADRYAAGHIAGAIHLPCEGQKGLSALRGLAPGTALLLYDADGRSGELSTAAATAALRGVSTVYTLSGGFSAWLRAGLDAESGTCDHCAP